MFQHTNLPRGTLGKSWPRRRLLLCGVGLAAATSHPAVSVEATAGHVEEVKGQAIAELASLRRVLIPSADVYIGDDVTTAESSRLAMLLGSDTSLRLGALTHVRIDRFIANAGGVLTLENGPLLIDKMPGGPSKELKVRGAFGMIAIRGTKVFVGPSNGVIGIFVAHGVITVTAAGQSFALQAGEGTNIAEPRARPTQPAPWGDARIRAALASVF